MVARTLVALALLAGCTDQVFVSPVIDQPVDDPDASAFPTLDEIIITVAHDGSDRDLISASFTRGEDIAITGAPFGDDLVVHMTGFVSASNVAYGRTCAFHVDANNAPPTPHLFFSRSGKFAGLGITPEERTNGRAVSYLGSALVLGGDAGGTAVSTVERFDPATGTLTAVGSLDDRTGAVEAEIGTAPPRVVVLGGEVHGTGAAFVEIVDPSRKVDRIDDLAAPVARIGLTATTLTDGRVVAIGGMAPGGAPVGAISELTAASPVDVRTLRSVLKFPRTGHTATRLGNDLGAPVLIAGGSDGTGAAVSVAELFKPLSDELADPLKFAPLMRIPRANHQAALMPDGSVLIIGGVDAAGDPVSTLERFTLDGGFEVVGELPAPLVDFSATTLPDGRVLITGGRQTRGGPATTTAFIVRLDPLDGSVDVVPTDRLAAPRANHQAALLCDGTVLITGGTAGPAVAERYNPSPDGRR